MTEKERDERISHILLAMAVCQSDAKSRGFGVGKAGRAKIECPVCKGALWYSVASVNGHLWGKCSTKGCVSWMQ
jgi:hypothetical protein